MSFVENRAPFFGDFGSDAVIAGEVVRGVFDNGYGSAFDGMVGGLQPAFICESDRLADVDQDMTLTHAEIDYSITNIEPDGTGMSTLRLRKI